VERFLYDFGVDFGEHLFDYTRGHSISHWLPTGCASLTHRVRFAYNTRMTFYTSKGDDGTTNLLGEGRVAKYHSRIEAVGTLDESTAALGLARAQCLAPRSGPILLEAQRDLYKLMAEVAATPKNAEKFRMIDEKRVTWLEQQTDEMSKLVEMPREFILPGDSLAGAALSLARAVIRRAERRVVELFDLNELSNPDLQRYLNRLSSLCFVLELVENKAAGHQTTLAKS
jgi:cob(I)alamin adenosyltransferase